MEAQVEQEPLLLTLLATCQWARSQERFSDLSQQIVATKNDVIAAKDAVISSKDEVISSKDEVISANKAIIDLKDALIEMQNNLNMTLVKANEQLGKKLCDDDKNEQHEARNHSDSSDEDNK